MIEPNRYKTKIMLEKETIKILNDAIENLGQGFSHLPELNFNIDHEELKQVIIQASERMKDNFPYFHPLYAGQMTKSPHPVAKLAYMMAMWINPNNHALDGGRASSYMEKEAVAEIAKMIGWNTHLGHLTSGGTFANLEALWIAGQLNPDKKIIASEQAHYTHSRISGVLKLNFESVHCDSLARMDINSLEEKLRSGNVGTVVATIGTTATGSVDPLTEILALKKKYGFRIHVDSAYGGYFKLADNLDEKTQASYDLLSEVDSVVIDPHKHGLQPYGCGCVLFKDPAVGKFYKHDSPYTYFSSDELHLGEISLECSRAGASAVGLWTTLKLLPLIKGGEFGRMLSKGRLAAKTLYDKLEEDKRFITAFPPELDILIWIPKAKSITEISGLSRKLYAECERNNLYFALAELPVKFFDPESNNLKADKKTVTCLRSVLMKPEHYEWIDRIWDILNKSAEAVLD